MYKLKWQGKKCQGGPWLTSIHLSSFVCLYALRKNKKLSYFIQFIFTVLLSLEEMYVLANKFFRSRLTYFFLACLSKSIWINDTQICSMYAIYCIWSVCTVQYLSFIFIRLFYRVYRLKFRSSRNCWSQIILTSLV